jgi:hypothetical protein
MANNGMTLEPEGIEDDLQCRFQLLASSNTIGDDRLVLGVRSDALYWMLKPRFVPRPTKSELFFGLKVSTT